MPDVVDQVRGSLNPEESGISISEKLIKLEVIKKPSVTLNMIRLSWIVFVMWVVISGIFGVRLFLEYCSMICIGIECSFGK